LNEHWLVRHEAVFFARLLPIVPHLISIPAGIVRLNFWIFGLLLTDPEALARFIHGQSTWILVAVFAALYILSMRLSKPSQKHPNGG
jgi:hypothetical protein